MLLICLVSIQLVNGQVDSKKKVPNLPVMDQKKLHFGFIIGFNTMNFNVQNSGMRTEENGQNARYAQVLNLTPGLNLGIVSSLKLSKYFNLRVLPGISFGQRNLSYIDEYGVIDDDKLEIKSTFLELPVLIKYSGLRINNFKPYLVGGFNTRYDLAKSKQDGLLLNSLDYYLEVGAGFDFYMTYFRLSTELKVSLGLRDVLNHDGVGEIEYAPYTQAIDKLTSRIFVLSFSFEGS